MRPDRSLTCGLLCALVLLTGGCESLRPDPAPHVPTLGFLGDYSELRPGRKGQASLIFIDAAVDFSSYSEMLVDPVVALEGPNGEPAADARTLAERLDGALRRELAEEFELVDRPGANAFRMRAALARSADSQLVLEVELLESATKRRVVGAVDHHGFESSGEAADALDAWAVLIRNRLGTLRQFDSAARAREAGGLEDPAGP